MIYERPPAASYQDLLPHFCHAYRDRAILDDQRVFQNLLELETFYTAKLDHYQLLQVTCGGTCIIFWHVIKNIMGVVIIFFWNKLKGFSINCIYVIVTMHLETFWKRQSNFNLIHKQNLGSHSCSLNFFFLILNFWIWFLNFIVRNPILTVKFICWKRWYPLIYFNYNLNF
jgi:hypothetical protein